MVSTMRTQLIPCVIPAALLPSSVCTLARPWARLTSPTTLLPSKYSACHWNNLCCEDHSSQFQQTPVPSPLLFPLSPPCLNCRTMAENLLEWCCLHLCLSTLSFLFRPDSAQGSSWHSLNLISSLSPVFLSHKYLMITARRSALVPKDMPSNAPASSNNVSDMIDFSVWTFASSSSHCITFCAMRASASSHSAVWSVLVTSVRVMITECVILEQWKETCLLPCLELQITDRFLYFLPIVTTTSWNNLNIRPSPWSRPLPLYSFLHFGRQLRSFVSVAFLTFTHVVVHHTSSCSAALSWTRCQAPCSCREVVPVRLEVFDYLAPEPRVTTCRRIQNSRCANMVLDQRDSCQRHPAFLFRRVIYRHFDFRKTNIQFPKCSSVDWNQSCSSTLKGLWSALIVLESRLRCPCVVSTAHERVMMRLRRQNHKTKIRGERYQLWIAGCDQLSLTAGRHQHKTKLSLLFLRRCVTL